MPSKITPGPWKTVDYMARAEIIKNPAGQDMVMRQDGATLADMRLMAAAPDLLEALQGLLDHCDRHNVPTSRPALGEFKAFADAYAAIAKAAGETA